MGVGVGVGVGVVVIAAAAAVVAICTCGGMSTVCLRGGAIAGVEEEADADAGWGGSSSGGFPCTFCADRGGGEA